MFKSRLPGRSQFLVTEIPLKMMKNVPHFTLKALIVLKILYFCPEVFSDSGKRLENGQCCSHIETSIETSL